MSDISESEFFSSVSDALALSFAVLLMVSLASSIVSHVVSMSARKSESSPWLGSMMLMFFPPFCWDDLFLAFDVEGRFDLLGVVSFSGGQCFLLAGPFSVRCICFS